MDLINDINQEVVAKAEEEEILQKIADEETVINATPAADTGKSIADYMADIAANAVDN